MDHRVVAYHAGFDAASKHSLEPCLCLQHIASPGTCVQHRTVSHDIWLQARVNYPLEPCLSLLDIARSGARVDHCIVGDQVRLATHAGHPVNPHLCPRGIASPAACTDERVVHRAVDLGASPLHPLEDPLDIRDAVEPRDRVDQRCIGAGRAAHAASLHAVKPVLRFRDVACVGAGVDHGAVAHRVHGKVLLEHVLDPSLRPVGVLGACAGGDDSVVDDDVGLEAGALHLLQEHLDADDVPALPSKGLGGGVEAHGVTENVGLAHLSKHACGTSHVVALGVEVDQHIKAHGVRCEAVGLHLIDQGRCALKVARLVASTQGARVADEVRLHASLEHALDALLRRRRVAVPGVHAYQGIVALRRRLQAIGDEAVDPSQRALFVA
mmetsp:Transcript_72075/g.211159  ORF Transcript_72075/g.211159 Transcript_72075/m.211159 type:complete len:382 (+) Transcript_72075:499-1644(+)